MKNKIIIGLLCLFAIGCSKEKKNEYPIMNTHPNLRSIMDEDELRPILIEKVVKLDNSPIPGSLVVLINGTDTLIGQTNTYGEVTINLPRVGVWDLTVTHAGYISLHTQVSFTDSLSLRTDTLQEE